MKRKKHRIRRARNSRKHRGRGTAPQRGLPEILRDSRQALRELVIASGLEQFQVMLEEDRTALCGERHAQAPERQAHRYGYDEGPLTFGGRRVRLRKPRVRGKNGGEVELPHWAEFSERDPLDHHVVNQMLIGVSTRDYERSLEKGPAESESIHTTRSSVSRSFVSRTAKGAEEFLNREIKDDDFPVLLFDGKEIGGHMLVIALGVDREGRKRILGLSEGTTENAEVCKSLLQNLIARGLAIEQLRLVVIDGGKALRKAIKEVFGAYALVQRCRVHKLRNVVEHLPEQRQGAVKAALKRAWGSADLPKARRQLRELINLLRKDHPGAAGSIEEGLEETLTVMLLGLDGNLSRLFCSTNMIENVNGTLQRVVHRVKRWRNGEMVVRWAVTGAMVAEQSFRRILGYKDMPRLIAALQAHNPANLKKAVNQ